MVCWSVHAAITGWFINNRNLLLIVPEAGSPRLGCHRGLTGPSLSRRLLLTVSLCGGMVRELCGFSEGTNPIQEGSTLWPSHFPKTTPPNIITLGIRVSVYGFGGDVNIQLIAEGYMCQIEYVVLKGEKEPWLRCGSVGWGSFRKGKGCRFDS